MREIKFRAWDKELKRMCKVIQIDFVNRKIIVFHESEDERSNWLDLDRFILMQFTGMKDINQNEVYENCIYRNNENNCIGVLKYDACGLWATEYKNGELYNNLPFRDLDVTDFEIIGNKYENPELLEG